MIQAQAQSLHTQYHGSINQRRVDTFNPALSVFERLSELSSQNQWVLFTSETPRPSAKQLEAHAVCCNRVIHMKASSSQPEEIIVMKAIQSGNASAVVASDAIAPFNQAQLKSLARQYQCEVFFIPSSPSVH